MDSALFLVTTSASLFDCELHRRTVGEIAPYECPSEGQREGAVIHVFVRI